MQYNYQLWRHSRNEKAISETREQANTAGEFFHHFWLGNVMRLIGSEIEYCRWDRPVATIQTDGYPLSMAFHSFDQQIVVANETDTIRYLKTHSRAGVGLIYRTVYMTGQHVNV